MFFDPLWLKRQHASQFPDDADWDSPSNPGEMVRGWAEESGEQAGVHYAEAYRRIVLVREEDE